MFFPAITHDHTAGADFSAFEVVAVTSSIPSGMTISGFEIVVVVSAF